MADLGRTDPFSDVISLVAGPIAAVIRSFEQLRRGADEMLKGFENFNATMRNLNETAERVNRLLNDFEAPVRAMLPQITRTVKLADEMAERLSTPLDEVVPGLSRLAATLDSPVLRALPTDLGQFLDIVNDLGRRMSPLAQIAEQAGGLFGLRIPGFGGGTSTSGRHGPCAGPRAGRRGGTARRPPRRPGRRRRRSGHRRRGRRPGKRLSDPNGAALTAWRRTGSPRPSPAAPCRARRSPTGVPTPSDGGTNARAMPWPRTGEKLPLVTSPTASPSTSTAHPARGGRRPSVAMPTRWRATPASRSASSAARPRNVGLPHATTQPRPACSGVMPGPSSWPCNGNPASSRSVSRAPSPAGTMPAPTIAAHSVGRGLGGHGDLDAALARVAGAGDRARHAVATRRGRRGSVRRRRHRGTPSPGGRSPADPARPARRARASSRARRWPRGTRSVFDALGITSKTFDASSPSPGCHHTMMSSSTEPSASSSRWVYCARPGATLARSFDSAVLQGRPARRRRRPHRAEVGHVEHDGVVAAGEVLGDRAGRRTRAACPSRRTAPSGPRARGGRRRAASAPPPRPSSDRPAGRGGGLSPSRRTSWASRSSLTPDSGSTLSTPWPRFSTSTSWSPSHSMTWVPLITMWAAAMSDVTCWRR